MENIEAGKFYRMRCGGAVKIVTALGKEAISDDTTWTLNGNWITGDSTGFDLIAEITEAEYNRIIAGENGRYEPSEAIKKEWDRLLYKQADLYVKIEELQAENARLTGEVNRLSENTAFDRISEKVRQDERRFEAAKSAMSAIIAHSRPHVQVAVGGGIEYADALLKALEVK